MKNEKKKENEKIKDTIKKTKGLIKENIIITEKLYDKLEKGEIKTKETELKNNTSMTLKKKFNLVNLLGISNEKPNFKEINFKIDEIHDFDAEKDERKSKLSDSAYSIDCDIECES